VTSYRIERAVRSVLPEVLFFRALPLICSRMKRLRICLRAPPWQPRKRYSPRIALPRS
jgi:hypothetical protein